MKLSGKGALPIEFVIKAILALSVAAIIAPIVIDLLAPASEVAGRCPPGASAVADTISGSGVDVCGG
ncbi:MAG: hypothetical protein ABEJ03_00970 [Candidatus Nanohaloarchaea archaeon]